MLHFIEQNSIRSTFRFDNEVSDESEENGGKERNEVSDESEEE